jgi:hypothetical protein
VIWRDSLVGVIRESYTSSGHLIFKGENGKVSGVVDRWFGESFYLTAKASIAK